MTTIDRSDVDGSSIDVLDPQLYQGDPHPTYAWLRDNDPVHWDEKNQLWVLSRFDDVVKVSVNDAIFCSGKGIRPDPSVDLSLIGYDGEKHQAQRRLINKGFTPKAVRALEDHIRALADAAIDEVAARGECDFVTDIAVAVPITVIAELMGLPLEDRERFWRWSDDMMAGGSAGEGPEFDDVRGEGHGRLGRLHDLRVGDDRRALRASTGATSATSRRACAPSRCPTTW